MIYIPSPNETGCALLILEQGHIDNLKEGATVTTPDGRVAVMFSHDGYWLAEQLQKVAGAGILTLDVLDSLHRESMTRPLRQAPPDHPTRHIVKDSKPHEEMP